jgi:hypothetical protein
MEETKAKVVIISLSETHSAPQGDGWLGKLHSHAFKEFICQLSSIQKFNDHL